MSSSTKMVNIANKLGQILGSDASKYEEAMKKRLEKEMSTLDDVEETENDFREPEDDLWIGWEDDLEEDKKPLKRKEQKYMRDKDKERSLQRKKQRESKIIYRSDDSEVPLYGYEEDWE